MYLSPKSRAKDRVGGFSVFASDDLVFDLGGFSWASPARFAGDAELDSEASSAEHTFYERPR